MRTLLVLALAVSLAGLAFAADLNKAALEDAIHAYDAGLSLTKAQDNLLNEYYFNHNGNGLDNSGGPDLFGYIYTDSEEQDGPVYSWVDIIATGTEVAVSGLLGDDDIIGPYPVGFNFPFYGTDRIEFWVNSNGSIGFSSTLINLTNYLMPTTNYNVPFIAWFWDDLDPDNGNDGLVYYETMTINDMNALVVEFYQYDQYPDGDLQDNITAEVILFEDGTILMQYNTLTGIFDIDESTIGIQGNNTMGLTVLFNGSIVGYPYDGLAIQYEVATPDAWLTGTVTDYDTGDPIEGAEVTVAGNTDTTGPDGVYTINDLYSVNVSLTATAAGYTNFGPVAINLVPGENSYDFQMAMPPAQLFFTDFESGPEPFSTSDPSAWEFGTPAVNPTGAYSGVNAWSTYLAGNYLNSESFYLISDPMTIMSPAAYMTYWAWYDYETGFDGYNVNVSTDGGTTWTVVTPDGGYPDLTVTGLSGGPGFTGHAAMMWTQITVQLGVWQGQEIMIGFRHGTDSSVNSYSGASIDDFTMYDTGVEPDPVTLTLTPTNAVIPPAGGNVVYDLHLVSIIGASMANLRYQTFVTTPGNVTYGPLANLPWNLTPFMDVTVTGLTQTVPGAAPAGTYTFQGIAGVPNNPNLQVTDSFTFDKTAPGADNYVFNPEDWTSTGRIIADDAAVTVTLPSRYAMNEPYPNPFNPTTTVTVALPQTSELTVSVFNVMGQQVAELANGKFSAGQHTFSFDGANLASGLYFIRAQVPGQLNAIQKVTLMK